MSTQKDIDSELEEAFDWFCDVELSKLISAKKAIEAQISIDELRIIKLNKEINTFKHSNPERKLRFFGSNAGEFLDSKAVQSYSGIIKVSQN